MANKPLEVLRAENAQRKEVRELYDHQAHDIATAVIGVDTLWGGDILQESGTNHFIADSWTSEAKPPEVYWDARAQALREKGGVLGGVDAATVSDFIGAHRLYEAASKMVTAGYNSLRKMRGDYLRRTGRALITMLDTAVAASRKSDLPSFQQRYLTGTGKEFVGKKDPADAREALRKALSKAGYDTTPSRDLRETFLAWEKGTGVVAPEDIRDGANEFIELLLDLSMKRIFKPLMESGEKIRGQASALSDARSGLEFRTIRGARFTGSLAYRGGQDPDGRPLLRALYEYNTDHPMTESGLLHLCSHEIYPGHALNMSFIDLLSMALRLDFEATLGTMCTPAATFQEGWAENAFPLLFGSIDNACEFFDGMREGLGTNLRVTLANAYLESFGKHNAPALVAKGMADEDVLEYVARECVQTDIKAGKLLRWGKHPIMGAMYSPGYLIGTDTVREALRRNRFMNEDDLQVARVGLHLEGLVDNVSFGEKFQVQA